MTEIKLFCTGGRVTAQVQGILTAGMTGIPVLLSLDEAWKGFTPRLIAECAGIQRSMAVAGGASAVPWECLIGGGKLKLGVDGWDTQGKKRIPTEWAICGTVKPSVGEADPEECAEPTPEEIVQLTMLAQQAADTADSVRKDADEGKLNGKPGPVGPPGPPGPVGPPGPPGPSGVEELTAEDIENALGYIPAEQSELSVQGRKLDALWKLNQGISYDFQTDSTEAYSKTAPAGAKMMDIKRIGGHSEAIDGALVPADVDSVIYIGKNLVNRFTMGVSTNRFVHNDYPFVEGKTYTLSYYGPGCLLGVRQGSTDSNNAPLLSALFSIGGGQNSSTVKNVTYTFQWNWETQIATFQLYRGGKWEGYPLENVQIEEATEPTPYVPYHEPVVLQIPETIRNLPEYGQTGATVDFENRIYTKPDGTSIDISGFISEDFAEMEVEAGGRIAFHQSTGLELPIPNTIEYLISLAEVAQ